MKLAIWMTKKKITQEKLAPKLGVTRVAISYWLHGSIPRRASLAKIVKLTKGAVTYNDFC
jgi:transcriptional regulator with XRE-family HTH domain